MMVGRVDSVKVKSQVMFSVGRRIVAGAADIGVVALN